jgi:hypothetical protein
MRSPRLALVLVVASVACAPQLQRIAPPTGASVEFWREPVGRTDLFFGVGGRTSAPDPDATYTLVKRDEGGFSVTMDLRDAEGRKWSAKIGPEATTEVIASRIVWAMGYPQPPSYHVFKLPVKKDGQVTDEGPARLRPDLEWLENRGTWKWAQNPFVGTEPYRGLIVLMMILNSTDLKDDNNTLYFAERRGSRPTFWYTVKDLGATFGETGRFSPKRGDIESFEKEPFLKKVSGPFVEFAFKGRHKELLDNIGPADIRWTCRRLQRITDAQLRDAFRAGGFSPETATRFVRRIRQKVREGLALEPQRQTS